MADNDTDNDTSDSKGQPVWLVMKKPYLRPGTPEAHRAGCLCSFEGNMAGAIASADRDDGWRIIAIHNDCPLHHYSTERPGGVDPDDVVDIT